MDPITASLIISAIMGAANSAGSSISNSRNSRRQAESDAQSNALRESELNPFRHGNAQISAIRRLDRQANTTPREMTTGAHGYATQTGGNYTISPEVQQWLTEMRNRIARGDAQNPGISPRYTSGVQNLTMPGGGNAWLNGGRTPQTIYTQRPW